MSAEIELHVPASEGVTDRYAEASGDHNPIHLDQDFAISVGLPGRILHGLWTAAQVARAATSVSSPLLGSGAEARYGLQSLSVPFRGMGRIGPEVVVTGSAGDPIDELISVSLSAAQDGTRLVRNATARVRVS
jgi:hypothetical protein